MANERLKQAMTSAGLDVKQLAHAVGVDAKTVERWLGGRTPIPAPGRGSPAL